MKWDVIMWYAWYKRLLNIGFVNKDIYSSYSLTRRIDFFNHITTAMTIKKKILCNEVSYYIYILSVAWVVERYLYRTRVQFYLQ